MDEKETIKMIHSLITINNNRIEGYEIASRVTKELDIKKLFAQFILTSRVCNKELVEEVVNLRGKELKSRMNSGKFFSVWLDVKAALSGKDREKILKSCAFGEEKALESYSIATENEMGHLTSKQHSMINLQKSLIKADHELINSLREIFENT